MKLVALVLFTLGLAQAEDLKCQSGEVPDPSGICIEPRFIQGCHEYASPFTCNKCEYRYKLNQSGLCEFQKISGQPCCLQKRDGKCVTCNIGLLLQSDGSCTENTIVGCLEKKFDGTCKNCASEYYLDKDGKCKPGIKQCDKYLGDDKREICTSCKKNYSLVNNACLKNKILGCEYEINHKCQRCLDPFKKKDDHCQITNCSTYNDFGCTACECGFFLTAKNTCQEIQPGCIRYQRGVCNDCQTHFRLRGGACVMEGCKQLDFLSCNKCAEGYKLVGGGCKLNNCQSWDNGVCYVCDNGFVTQQGRCIAESSSSINSV